MMFKTCQICGIEFKISPSRLFKRKTCSKECQKALQDTRQDVICSICRRVQRRPRCQLNRGKRSYCNGCRRKWNQKPIPEIFKNLTRKTVYLLGLLASDGHNKGSTGTIRFGSNDKELSEFVKDCLGERARMRTERTQAGNPHYRVQLQSRLALDYLILLGIVPKKSKILRMPKFPPELFWDFFRGYFDGNGTAIRTRAIQICTGSINFAHDLVERLKSLGFTSQKIRKSKLVCAYYIVLNQKESQMIAKLMYDKDFPFALERKRRRLLGLQ